MIGMAVWVRANEIVRVEQDSEFPMAVIRLDVLNGLLRECGFEWQRFVQRKENSGDAIQGSSQRGPSEDADRTEG